MADSLDIRRILTCGFGFWRTGWTDGIDLRIRRLGVRVPPSAPLFSQVIALTLTSLSGVPFIWPDSDRISEFGGAAGEAQRQLGAA